LPQASTPPPRPFAVSRASLVLLLGRAFRWSATLLQRPLEAVNEILKVRRDRFSDKRGVQPLKVACDGEL
jgi:hypothetical protein